MKHMILFILFFTFLIVFFIIKKLIYWKLTVTTRLHHSNSQIESPIINNAFLLPTATSLLNTSLPSENNTSSPKATNLNKTTTVNIAPHNTITQPTNDNSLQFLNTAVPFLLLKETLNESIHTNLSNTNGNSSNLIPNSNENIDISNNYADNENINISNIPLANISSSKKTLSISRTSKRPRQYPKS